MGKRKKLLILILLFCLPFLLGDKLFDVQLKNTDKDNPLVKMEALIKLGGEYASGRTSESADDPSKESHETAEANKNGTEGNSPKQSEKEKITVRVMNKRIMINTSLVEPADFEQAFKNVHKKGIDVELVDDFAEYFTFLKVVNFFNSNSVKYKLSFVE